MLSDRMVPATTIDELESVAAIRRALVFFFVEWAIQAVWSRNRVEAFLDHLTTKVPLPPPCYVIDLTEQSGPVWVWVRHWLDTSFVLPQPERGGFSQRLMYSGRGSLLWVNSGEIVDSIDSVETLSLEQLEHRTRDAFPDLPGLSGA